MNDIFSGKVCTYYKSVIDRTQSGKLTTSGTILPILDVLTNQRYTNYNLLNDLRNSGYKSDFYLANKKKLSAACFSSIQDDVTIDRCDENHLFHTGFLSFDIDTDKNPSLMNGCEDMVDFIINNLPYIAYLGKSVSNLGLWGLVPILSKDDHYAHYAALVKEFSDRNIYLDKLSDISRLRFLAYDPDAHFELEPQIFEDTLFEIDKPKQIERYERNDVTDNLFMAACKWVEAKHNIKFQPGSIHNYLLYLYSTLRYAHVSRAHCLNWIYNNLIEADKITTNCLDEIEFKK